MSVSLYQLTTEFMEIANQLEEYELDEQTLQDTLDSLQAPLEAKAENIIKYMKSLEALAEAKKAEAKKLIESAAKDLKKAEWFKEYLSENLRRGNVKTLQAGVFSLGWRKGSEVVEIDIDRLPMDYWIVPDPEPIPFSKNELKKLIKAGEEIPGVNVIRKPDTLQVK